MVAMAYNKGSRKVYKGHKFVSRVQTTKKAKNRDSEKKTPILEPGKLAVARKLYQG